MKAGRTRRYLLRASALTVGTLIAGCGSKQKGGGNGEEIHGNPKGSVYDQGAYDAGPPDAAPPTEPEEIYGNPKGSVYDDGAYE